MESAAQQQQEQAARQQQEAQQTVGAAQQVLHDREFEAKVLEIQKKYELESMKQESLNDARRQKTQEQLDIAEARAERDDARKDAQAAAEIRRKDTVAEAG